MDGVNVIKLRGLLLFGGELNEFSEQIIKILDNLSDKFGMTIDCLRM